MSCEEDDDVEDGVNGLGAAISDEDDDNGIDNFDDDESDESRLEPEKGLATRGGKEDFFELRLDCSANAVRGPNDNTGNGFAFVSTEWFDGFVNEVESDDFS